MNFDFQLTALQDAELIHAAKDHGDEFLFKHALTQETAYRSLLKTQRRDLHRAVAQAIEKTFPDQKGKLSDVLAYHWELAEVPERARRYLYRAAQDATRRYANQEALALFERALAASAGAKPEEMMALHEARGRIYEFLSQYAQAIADYQAALPLARQAKLAVDECRIMSRIAWMYSLGGEGEQAVALATQVEVRARELGDQSAALRAYLVQGLVAQARGDLQVAYPRLRAALAASRASDEPVMEGESWFYLGIQNNFMGRFGRAAACARRAYELKKGLSDRVGEIVSLYLWARAETGQGNYDIALDTLEQGHAVAKVIRNPFGLAQYPNTRAWLAAELGDWETAYDIDHAGLTLAVNSPIRPPEISTRLNLMLDCIALGKLQEADAHILELMKWFGRTEFGFHAWRWQIRFTDAQARLLLAHRLYDDAALIVSELMDWAERTQSAKYKMRALLMRAQIYLANDQIRLARDSATMACHLADAMAHMPGRIQSQIMLAQISDRMEPGSAQQYRAQAAQLLKTLDASLKHPALRRSFERGLGNIQHVA